MTSPKNTIHEIITNIIFTAIKSIFMLMVVNAAGAVFTPYMLGIFLLSRRISNTGANLIQLGMSQTIQRYVSLHLGDRSKYHYIFIALCIWIVIAFISFPAIYLFVDFFSGMFFPNYDAGNELVIWTLHIVILFGLHYIIYSSLLAERKIVQANIVELLNSSGFILLIFLIIDQPSVSFGIKWQAILMLVLSGCYFMKYLFEMRNMKMDKAALKEAFKIFVHYGTPRGLISFLEMLFLMISPWLLRVDPEQLGYLLISLTLFNMISTLVLPVSQIVSLSIARVLNQDPGIRKKQMNWMFGSLLYTSLILTAVILPWCKELLEVWLGNETLAEGAYSYTIIIFICLLPYTLYRGMKGLIEMMWVKPYNLIVLICAILVHVGSYYILLQFISSIDAVKASILLGCCTLGIFTIAIIYSDLHHAKYLGFPALAMVLTFIFALNFVGSYFYHSIYIGSIFMLSTMAAGLFVLYLIKPPFVKEIIEYLMPVRFRKRGEI